MMRPTAEAPATCLGLGSNLGDRARHLAQAIMRLALQPRIDLLRVSPVYETAPWGVEDQPSFLNMAIGVRTRLSAQELLAVAKSVEADLGRVARRRWGPRVIDVDILTFGNTQVNTPELTVPHPQIPERQFVLVPLADIAPLARVSGDARAIDLADPASPDLSLLGPLGPLVARPPDRDR